MDQQERPLGKDPLDAILGEFGMRAERVAAGVSESGETFEARIVVPDRSPGAANWAERLIGLPWLERGDPAMHRRAARLRRLQEVATESRLRYRRRLNYMDVRRSRWFRDSKRLLGPDLSLEGLVRTLGQRPELSDEELLESALYPLRLPDLPADEEEYMTFTNCILESLDKIFESLNMTETAEDLERDLLNDPQVKRLLGIVPTLLQEKAALQAALERDPMSVGERREATRRLRLLTKAQFDLGLTGSPTNPIEWQAVLRGAWPRVVQKVLKQAAVTESTEGGRLHEMGLRAETILNQMVMDPQDDRDSIAVTIDLDAIDSLLADTIDVLRTSIIGDASWSEQCAHLLELARGRNDPSEKINRTIDIWRQFRDRGAMIEHLLREADLVLPYCLGEAARELYRRIRRHLTSPERRLFALMWLPRLPRFGMGGSAFPFAGQALWSLPFAGSLMSDGELVALTILVFGFKRHKSGSDDLARSLESLYRKHLAFYAWWAPMARDEDKERKRLRRNREVQPPDEQFMSQVQDPEPAKFDFKSILDEVTLSSRQHRIARMYLVEERRQEEIARELKVSQQAVSKLLRKVARKLEQALPWKSPRDGAAKFRVRSLCGRPPRRSSR